MTRADRIEQAARALVALADQPETATGPEIDAAANALRSALAEPADEPRPCGYCPDCVEQNGKCCGKPVAPPVEEGTRPCRICKRPESEHREIDYRGNRVFECPLPPEVIEAMKRAEAPPSEAPARCPECDGTGRWGTGVEGDDGEITRRCENCEGTGTKGTP